MISTSSSLAKKSQALPPSDHLLEVEKKTFAKKIVVWFLKNQRDLPWRKTDDPYSIWISEMMLQQTGVSTVIPYYERFISRFPNIETLAAAPEHEILKLWEGLGYYRRARNLGAAAKLIVKEFNGCFPNTREQLLKLPGVGAYSSGSILSIAFRGRAAALDGNLIRVYSRYFGIKSPIDHPQTLKRLWHIAEALVPNKRSWAREFCEGMMELGAIVCRPKQPECLKCPIRMNCVARASNLEEILPIKAKKAKRQSLFQKIFLVERNGKIAFHKRGSDPLYPDFSRLPWVSLLEAEERSPDFRYAITFRNISVWIERLFPHGEKVKNLKWIHRDEVDSLTLPAIDRKILKKLL